MGSRFNEEQAQKNLHPPLLLRYLPRRQNLVLLPTDQAFNRRAFTLFEQMTLCLYALSALNREEQKRRDCFVDWKRHARWPLVL